MKQCFAVGFMLVAVLAVLVGASVGSVVKVADTLPVNPLGIVAHY